MLALIGGLRGILTAIGGAAIALALFTAWNVIIDNPGVRREARDIERAAWEEAHRKLRDQMDRERRLAQTAIDQIEREYLAQRDRDLTAIRDLETTINEMEKEDAETPASSRVLFPRRLSDAIGQIGR